ncbi:hypothetical protein ACFVT1_07790 [Streptomyces sp. NPDC057963]|uniref:hypothetical protein n=1 Tax=Streptomyces sp. NPDC057963 TaxID=3346290 RepID=UPI0036E25AFC
MDHATAIDEECPLQPDSIRAVRGRQALLSGSIALRVQARRVPWCFCERWR